MKTTIFALIILLLFSQQIHECVNLQAAEKFSTGKANFAIKFRDEISPYRILGVYVLPNEELKVEIENKQEDLVFRAVSNGGTLTGTSTMAWTWKAPNQPGLHFLTIKNVQFPDSIRLNIFVMVPINQLKGEYLNGYRIGKYPDVPLKKLNIYKPPRGFIEVTKANENSLISPHFKLKQFLTKQEGDYPKYVVLRERLLLKLELILEAVNDKGYACSSFNVMSGFRTPYYNKAIGNVKYSRHVWGGAADIFIDESPRDGMMDDLNRDGKIDYHDAGVLYDIIDELYGKTWYEGFVGGLGRYKKTSNHGPFVHVDVRGFRARWGS